MINTYNETDLHKTLKALFCPKDAKTEQPLLGSICDILCVDGTVIEIQTAHLTALRLKLEKFLPTHKVEIVYPIATESIISVLNKDGTEQYHRKSPKKGVFFQIFRELAGIYHLFETKRLKLKVVYITAEIIKSEMLHNSKIIRRRRHKGPGIINKKLVRLVQCEEYASLASICKPVLDRLPCIFTNKDLKNLGAGRYASYTTWFLKKTGHIVCIGKKERYNLYKKIEAL